MWNKFFFILPGVEPAVLANDFLSLSLVSPVTQHCGVTTGHKLALLHTKCGNITPACGMD